jgi:putative nucleotidyltransferase with HDIG domain
MMSNYNTNQKSILIVDDDTTTRSIIADALKETGDFITNEVENGNAALELFQKEPYDLVISDINMPGMSGIELLNKIKSIDPSTYVIMITGFPSIEISVSAMKDGAVDFITKPFKVDDLIHKTQLYLRQKSAISEEDMKLKVDYARLNDKIKELSTVNYIYDIIEKMEGDNDHIFGEIVSLASKVAGGESCSLLLFDEANDAFYPKIVTNSGNGDHHEISRVLTPIFREVARKKEPLMINASTNPELYKSLMCVPLTIRNNVFGLLNLITKQYEKEFSEKDLNYIVNLSTRASLNIENKMLYESIYVSILDTFTSLVQSIQVRDHYTEVHSRNVTTLSVKIAEAMKCSSHEIESLKIAAILHDVGKIAIPDQVLLKPGRLTDEEYTIIKNHPAIGENILKSITLFDKEREIIRHHHERWDGRGYPDGLSKTDIPKLSRIISVADSFDAMTSDRPYRKGLKIEQAIEELIRNCNLQFDKVVVDAFMSTL